MTARERVRLRPRLHWFRRRWWVLVIATIAVPLLAGVLDESPARLETTYTARSLYLVVPSSGLGSFELSNTYSLILSRDETLTNRLAERIGVEGTEVRARLGATKLPNASLVEVVYRSQEPTEPVAALRALTELVTGSQPVSPAVLPRSMVLVTPASGVTSDATRGSTGFPVALAIGVLLGIGLVLVLERVDARVDEEDALVDEIRRPVTVFDDPSDEGLAVLLARWSELSGTPATRIAIVPASGVAEQAAADATRLLLAQRVHRVLAADLRTVGFTDQDLSDRSVHINVTDAPGAPGSVEATARAVDLVVLVVAQGMRLDHLRRCLAHLEAFDVRPAWGILATRPFLRRAHANAPAPTPPGGPWRTSARPDPPHRASSVRPS